MKSTTEKGRILKKLFTKIISMTLCLLLIFYAVPSVIYGEVAKAFEGLEAGAKNDATDGEQSEAAEREPYELVELREPSVKHFRLADGSYVAAQYNYPVHYEGKDGELLDINNSLSNDGSGFFANETARIKFSKKINGSGKLFALHDGNTKLTLSIIGANKGAIGYVKDIEEDNSLTELQKMMTLENIAASVVYENIFDGVDLEYVAESLNIKENIIVKEKQDSYTYSFELDLNGLVAKALADGSIEIINEESGLTQYVIPAPIVFDASGSYAPDDAASYTLSGKDGKYSLTVSVDEAWMNSTERVFPITVDPTMYTFASNIKDTYISEDWPSGTHSGDQWLSVSTGPSTGQNLAYMKAQTLPTLPSGTFMTSAEFFVYCAILQNWSTIVAIEVETDWSDTTLTFNTRTNNSEGRLGDIVADVETVNDVGWYSFDVTSLARKWYDGYNYGFALVDDDRSDPMMCFESAETYNSPGFVVYYQKVRGLENYWSYSSQSVGIAGEGAINLATGGLTFAIPTLTTTDSLFSYTVSAVYDSTLAGKSFAYPNAEAAFSGSYMPYGFKLNLCETVVKKYYDSPLSDFNEEFIYVDSDGTEHPFYPAEDEDGYVDTDGLQKKITIRDGVLTMTDDSRVTKSFIPTTRPTDLAGAWMLSTVEDAAGNELIIDYDSAGRPSAVSVKPKNSSKIGMLELYYYTSGMLMCVYNPGSHDAVVFKHGSSGTSGVSASATAYLRTVEFIRGDSALTVAELCSYAQNGTASSNINVFAAAEYTYTSSGYLSTVYDRLDHQQISYEWSGSGVSRVSHTAQGENGQSAIYFRGEGYTDIRSSGSDDSISTPDDIITRYVYDERLRVVSSYSMAADGSEIYGGVMGTYETSEEIKNNIKEKTVVGGSYVNYILNGDFEELSGSAPKYWTLSGNASIANDNLTEYLTDYKLYLNPAALATASATQKVYLAAGDYTISFPYQNDAVDATARITVTSASGGSFAYTKEIILGENYATGSSADFSASFTLPSADAVNITISLTRTSSSGYAFMYVDNVMLEKGRGATPFNYVSYGSLDMSGYSTAGASVPISDYWTGNYDGIYSDDAGFGNVIKIGASSTIKYAKQRVYEISADDLSTYDNAYSQFVSNARFEYILSGYAKATNAAMSGGTFRIRADIIYYLGAGRPDVTVSYYLDFVPGCNGWQFVSGRIGNTIGSAHPSNCIRAIDISCEFGYQPDGYALFDNISLVNSSEEVREKYEYYGSGAAKGLVLRSYIGTYIEKYEYDNDRRITRVANNRGEITDYVYNSEGLLVYEASYDFTYNGRADTYVLQDYTENVNITSEIVGTRYTYNTHNLVTRTETFISSSAAQPVPGNRPKATNRYTYATDEGSFIFGALITESDDVTYITRNYYDHSNGRLVATVNEVSGLGTAYEYDDIGRLAGVLPATYVSGDSYSVTSDSGEIEYIYKDNSNIIDLIITSSTVYSFKHDEFGNIRMIGTDSAPLVEYRYNEYNGKLAACIYPNGLTVEYSYDSLENLTEIWYTKNEGRRLAYEYEYTSDGQIYKFVDHEIERGVIYEYDLCGRLIGTDSYSLSDSRIDFDARASYDEFGRVRQVDHYVNETGSGNTPRSFTYVYSYNTNHTLSRVLINSIARRSSVVYSYDAYDRISTKTHDYSSFDIQSLYTYDDTSTNLSGRVKTHTVAVDGNTTTYTYTYDSNGNITWISSGDKDVRYVYDDLNRLIREDNGFTEKTYIYKYDAAGNILVHDVYRYTLSTPSFRQKLSGIDISYYTGAWGDIATSINGHTITYDLIGNPLNYYNGQDYTFEWQGRQLRTAFIGSDRFDFAYDDAGIRTAKVKSGVITNYHYDGSLLVAEETDGNITVYIYDAEGTPIGMQYHGATYASGTWDCYWYEKNLLGDIVAVYDRSGTKLVSYVYDAWGAATVTYSNGGESTTAASNPFRYRGYYYDIDLGLYRTGTRYYDAVVGRFINPDDVMYLGANGDLNSYNLYAYCSNNPVMHTDHSGNSIFGTILIGAAIGFGGGIIDQAITGDWSLEVWIQTSVCTVEGAVTAVVGPIVGAFVSGVAGGVSSAIIGNDNDQIILDALASAGCSLLGSGAQLAVGRFFAGEFIEQASGRKLKTFANSLGYDGKKFKSASSWVGEIMLDSSKVFADNQVAQIVSQTVSFIGSRMYNLFSLY